MRVFSSCKNCKSKISITTEYSTRVDFAMMEGKFKELTCSNCKSKNSIHVNDLYAIESKRIYLIAGIIFLIGSIFTIYIMTVVLSTGPGHYTVLIAGGVMLIPGIISIVINRQEYQRVSGFNRMKVKR
ncbi:MAG: hypothetical protein AB8B59_11160 [Maribacter sp.]